MLSIVDMLLLAAIVHCCSAIAVGFSPLPYYPFFIRWLEYATDEKINMITEGKTRPG